MKEVKLEEAAYQFEAKMSLRQAIPLGLQHVCAMFVGNLPPLLIITSACGIAGGEFADLQVTLLQSAMFVAGIVTLVQLFTIGPVGGAVPIIMGTSSGFIGVFNSVVGTMGGGVLAYGAIMGASIIGGIFESVLGFFLKPLRRFFPPVVTGPIIISIGLILAPSAITNCQSNWLLAFVALGTVIVCNIWGKGMVKILPILIGVLVSYAVALVTGAVDFQKISEAAWLGIPLHKEAMGLFAIDGSPEFISALFTIIPIALATMMEHVGDIAAISATVGHNYINDPGLNRTLMGDGLATTMAGLLGGPANTTYGENTGVLALSKIYDPLVIRIAAVLAIILSFSPKFEAVINTIPTGIIGGISFVLYGMISAIGVRNVVENRVDFTNSRNLIVAAVILVCALGFNSVGGVGFTVGSVTINLSGLAVAAIAGILLNAILPGNDYEFDATAGSDAATSGNLQV